MDADGGMARFPTNKAGAKYGTGYCDSQVSITSPTRIVLETDHDNNSALVTSSTSMERPTSRAGTAHPPTLVLVPWVLAAPRWTSGRLTVRILLISS